MNDDKVAQTAEMQYESGGENLHSPEPDEDESGHYAGMYKNLEDYIRDCGDILMPGCEGDHASMRKALRNALYWLDSDIKWRSSKPASILNSTAILRERVARLGEHVLLAAYNQGYRAEHFE